MTDTAIAQPAARGAAGAPARAQGAAAPAVRGSHPVAEQPAMSPGAIVLLFIGLMVAMFMFSLNQTVLATALPTIVGELNGVDQMLWVSTAFMLASTIMMPIYGKIGDLFGRKPLFIFAILMFLVGSTFGVMAHSMGVLILGRVFQGIGGGGMMILSQSIIAAVVPARERGKYMGIMGATFAVSSVAGPLIGGWITEGPGWRWNFALNYPLGALALIAALIFLKVPKHHDGPRPKVDIAGMLIIAQFTTAMVLATAWGGHQYDWDDPIILMLIGVAVIAAVTFVFVELHAPNPMVPMTLFKDRNFVLCTVAGLFLGVAMFGVLSYMPTYLQMVHGIEATLAGFMMVPMMGVMLIVSTAVGFIVSKTGRYKWYPVIGIAIVGVSLVMLSRLKADSSPAEAMIGLGVMGLGLGLSMQILVLIVQNSFPVSMVGTATASNNFFRQIGATLGMSIIGSLFTNRLMNNLQEGMQGLGANAQKAAGGSSSSLTPSLVNQLPTPVHDVIVGAYNDALVPIFLWVAPLTLAAVIILLFVKEKELATRLEPNAGTEREVLGDDAEAPDEDRAQEPRAHEEARAEELRAHEARAHEVTAQQPQARLGHGPAGSVALTPPVPTHAGAAVQPAASQEGPAHAGTDDPQQPPAPAQRPRRGPKH
ncbi:DHA2 family efflux MFS transporter permease subunit [Brevibacterium sp. BRM-1]|uniref:MDR family MFS transporter n=1 Tax=Brevibacterium sp. BRM-1 TaxID=2999062 RepID=UPI002282F7E5|nr:DHA2 family efflux MFS transporter permease subunit [Brevibacterium sp. BRM-1]WAL41008.1 DHA2 family efflux MFS transporter permease subunit [Brevibacterium sp. BRM-1]